MCFYVRAPSKGTCQLCVLVALFFFVVSVILFWSGHVRKNKDDDQFDKEREEFWKLHTRESCKILSVLNEIPCTYDCNCAEGKGQGHHSCDLSCRGHKYEYSVSADEKCSSHATDPISSWYSKCVGEHCIVRNTQCWKEAFTVDQSYDCVIADEDCGSVLWEKNFSDKSRVGRTCIISGWVFAAVSVTFLVSALHFY